MHDRLLKCSSAKDPIAVRRRYSLMVRMARLSSHGSYAINQPKYKTGAEDAPCFWVVSMRTSRDKDDRSWPFLCQAVVGECIPYAMCAGMHCLRDPIVKTNHDISIERALAPS